MTAVAAPEPQAAPAREAPAPTFARALVEALGSMKLAVVLVVLLGVLTWLGTLAQVDTGLFDVQRQYFESWFVLAKLPLSIWGRQFYEATIPLPGAYPVMALLLANLLIGGMLRLRWSARNAGVLVVHVGIALLLVAGFVKLHFSYSGHISLFEPVPGAPPVAGRVHETSTFISFHDWELALLRDDSSANSDGSVQGTVTERTVPESVLIGARDRGVVTLRGDGLPFIVQVLHWVDNCEPLPKGPMVRTEMPVVDGAFLQPRPLDQKREGNFAGCYVNVIPNGADEKPQAGILFGFDRRPFDERRQPFTFTMQGQRYGLDLRRVVYDLPFAFRLDRFEKRDHPGTATPRDFRSFVTVAEGGTEREVQIFMNNPLRKDGYVVYQTSWGPPSGRPPLFSVFEVGKNPSDVWPAVACGVIGLGLLIHFVMKLFRFLLSSTRASLQA